MPSSVAQLIVQQILGPLALYLAKGLILYAKDNAEFRVAMRVFLQVGKAESDDDFNKLAEGFQNAIRKT